MKRTRRTYPNPPKLTPELEKMRDAYYKARMRVDIVSRGLAEVMPEVTTKEDYRRLRALMDEMLEPAIHFFEEMESTFNHAMDRKIRKRKPNAA